MQHQQLPPRPKLQPLYPSAEANASPDLPYSLSGLNQGASKEEWVSIISAPAFAPLHCWLSVMLSLIQHPERNSSNILRADILSDSPGQEEIEGEGWVKQWTVHRALLPRRVKLDWRMEQTCTLYYLYHGGEAVEAVVVYTPLIGALTHPKMPKPAPEEGMLGKAMESEHWVPFYHPKVRALAFHFRPCSPSEDPEVHGEMGISLIPFSPEPCFPPNHRLSRVGLSLLTTLHMHTWGDLHSYTKRVHHDQLVPRDLYQDLYLSLKTKYASELIAGWAEATDPTKHVFEEMGIAAFLIALWSGQYGEGARGKVKFVDVGCGNGLLTYILAREGFKGVGLDLRGRKSWVNHKEKGAKLEEWTFDPASLLSEGAEKERWQGAWLLGNHADELTPWLPVLATHYSAAGFINLPCCYYALDGTKAFPLLLKGGGTVPRNEQYLAYVSELQRRFGWKVELEPLRIPSTKNWCFVGRERQDVEGLGEEGMRERVKEAVQEAVGKGWAARTSSK